MGDLVVHDSTRAQIDSFLANPAHAVLFAGSDGIGKAALAEQLLQQLLTLDKTISDHPHFMRITPTGDSISIEAIRTLQKFLQLKTPGSQPLRRAVLVEHAGGLTTEAQNAFLKLLEEPPADTVIVLTVDSPRRLLPTILSRVQTISVQSPTEDQLQPLLAGSKKDAATLRQAYFLSGGLPGLLTALIAEDQTHPLLESVSTAKTILQKEPFERLALADSLSKEKDSARLVLKALQRIAESGLQNATDKQDAAHLARWHRIRKQATEALRALDTSASPKLVLTNSFLQL